MDGLGENQITGGQVNLDVFLGEVELDDAVACLGIKRDRMQLAVEVRGRAGAGEAKAEEKEQDGGARHILSVMESAGLRSALLLGRG